MAEPKMAGVRVLELLDKGKAFTNRNTCIGLLCEGERNKFHVNLICCRISALQNLISH